ncbi:MAG: YfhO family protein [Armatimonadetes bacterium]|nr:YfhO family protein [Armatimonadota bacterium]
MRGLERRTQIALAVLALVPFIFFCRGLPYHGTLIYDDLAYWFYPWKSLMYRMAQQGHVSLWLPYELCGMPHIADIQRQIFYPPNLVFYLLPTHVAMVGFVAFHFSVAGLGMYALLRHMDVPDESSRLAAVTGGMIFAFSAFPVLHLTQLPMLSSYVWTPLLLLAVELYWRQPSWPWLMAGAVVLALMLLGGAPQMVYISGLLALVWSVPLAIRAVRQCDDAFKVVVSALGMALVPMLAVALCALQIFPMAEMAMMSSRQASVPSSYSTIGTAAPYMLATLLWPYAWGNPQEDNWLGASYTFHEECFYMGLLTLVLVGAALGDSRRAGRAWYFLGIALVGLILSLGNHVFGFHEVVRAIVPMFGKFRVPARWMVWTVVAVSVLAAYGIDALARYRAPRDRRSLLAALPLIGALSLGTLATAAIVLISRHSPPLFDERKFALGLLCVGAAACVVTRIGGVRATWAMGLVSLLIGADLVWFASRYVRFEDPRQVVSGVGILAEVAARRGPFRIATHTNSRVPTQVATWCPVFGVYSIQGTNPLYVEPYIEYLYYSQAGNLPPRSEQAGMMHHNGFFVVAPVLNGMTRLLNLKYVLRVPTSGYLDFKPKDLEIAPIANPVGVAFLVRDFEVVPDSEIILTKLRDRQFQPSRKVYFHEDPRVKLDGPPGPPVGAVRVLDYQDDSLSVEVTSDRDTFVVFSELAYPGWIATVDGQPTPILIANSIFRAVPVKAGMHRIDMRFAPTSFHLGLLMSLATSIFLLCTWLVVLRRNRSRQ